LIRSDRKLPGDPWTG